MADLIILLALLVSAVSTISTGHFNCANLSSSASPCSCSNQSPTQFEIFCPQLDPKLALQIDLNSSPSVQLQCTTTNDPDFSILPSLQIGDVDNFYLRHCPKLPNISISELMSSFGIKRIKNLQIQSYNSYNNTLKKKHMEKLNYVTNLSLGNNGLTSLPGDIFEDMGNLTFLDMKFNYVDLPKEIFYFTPKLEVLELGGNNLTYLPPGIFKNLDRLRLLNLWLNRLNNLTRPVFSGVPNLETLDLNSNQMETIRPDLFSDLLKLTHLNLYGNAFISLPQGLLSRNTELKEFQMHENKRPIHLPPGFLANLTKIKTVRLSGSKITSLPEDMFSGSINVVDLHLNRNLLTTLPDKIFLDLENLEYLDLSQNKITSLPGGLFSRTGRLKTLKLYYNQIADLPSNLFLQLKNLEFLDLRFNKLRDIRGDQFKTLDKLRSLNISDNQLTTLAQTLQLDDYGTYSVLDNCKQLEHLQLANNSLTEIYGDWRLLFTNLKTLNLSFNRFQKVTISELDFLSNEVMIDLSNNNISLVNFWEFLLVANNHLQNYTTSFERDRVKQHKVKLDNNPFNCNCLLLPFVQFLQNGLSPEIQYLFNIPSQNLKCFEPMTLEKQPLAFVPQDRLMCELKTLGSSLTCPANCSCLYRPLDRGNVFNCEHQGLTNLPISLPLIPNTDHSELNLEGNQLHSFKLPDGRGYENLTHLYLAHNNLTEFNMTGISPRIKVLDLSNNNLTGLASETITQLESAPELMYLSLHNNPWTCDCDALPFIQLVKKSYKKVSYNVTCADGRSVDKVLESELCTEKASLIIFGCILVAILCFVVALVTTLYYRYRTEIHVYCYSSEWKALQWLVSNPDYDENKKYDAFVSYANEDHDFVVQKLVPFLEGEKSFKLCLHYRDWVPGDGIQEQILKSVQSSRRTIVVLSPNFLNSVWGTVEFKTAHAEALKTGTSKVIVIVYEDVGSSADLDEGLKGYLQMNTYLKWETPWFWKQLVYALPHPPEKGEDLKSIFGRLPKISSDSRNHEVLKNVQLKNGEVHYITESSEKVNGKEGLTSPANNTTLMIESMIEETKPKKTSPEKQNGAAMVAM
ncbi:protein toll-like [Macrosteles quadrilineatus]|uniref:protein toll-like n=1 Tax=Macrosteles quadrilineatus TaxID=74068 RepID=UPI0023E12DBE|nr:protein toll-like [Macrosteles quadrilineatus]